MKPFIFLHVPKTAGTTMRAILERQYSPEELYSVYEGSKDHHSEEQMKALSRQEQQAIKVFCGHFGLGVHHHLHGDLKYVTMLRDPVERVISYYHHAMSIMPRWKDRPISLIKFIQSRKDKQVDNLQTRLISGIDMPFNQCTGDMLWKAIENVERHFEFIGISEMFDESLMLLSEKFGWDCPFYVRENIGKGRPQLDYFSMMELNVVSNHNRYDSMLFAYAKRRLEQAVQKHEAAFEERLESFRSANSTAHETISARAVWA